MSDFTHFNKQGEAVMVDVSEKKDTVRAVSYTHLSNIFKSSSRETWRVIMISVS